MSKYFNADQLAKMDQYRAEIYAIREKMFAEFGVDPLDTDSLSSIAIYKIVKQYDPNFNINFARNGEDSKSGNVLIEQKATRVNPNPLTATGRPRTGYGTDASFQFHAMGTLEHPRYVFVARSEVDLSILRIYDIGTKANCDVIINHLMAERNKWLARGKANQEQMKRDVIVISEKYILSNCNFATQTTIDGCKVFKD